MNIILKDCLHDRENCLQTRQKISHSQQSTLRWAIGRYGRS